MSRSVSLFLLILLTAAGAYAILPPDAGVREPELRARRIRAIKEHEKRMEERRELAVREYERTKKAIEIPPWDRARILDGETDEDRQVAADTAAEEKKTKKNRFLVSIVLLILIGSAVGWVRFTTREE